MSIRKNQLSFPYQIKFDLISKADQKEILNCRTVVEAEARLNGKKELSRFEAGRYDPITQVSGSSVKYKTKNLFKEIFDEQDVNDFIDIASRSAAMEDEVIIGDLNYTIQRIMREGRQPLQCMIYATKINEKVFFNNEKKVDVWAHVIADFVNEHPDYILSINHMLVNWGMWKFQLTLLIKACGWIRENETLDEVIRDLYIDYNDDKVRFTVMRRLLHGLNKSNYQCAFTILRSRDFIGNEQDKKYFNVLKRKVEYATPEERNALYAVFRGVQGFNGTKRKRVEKLFGEVEEGEPEIVRRINDSGPDEKEDLLKEVHRMIYGKQKEYREIAAYSKDFRAYKPEIQDMFIQKIVNTVNSPEDIKIYGLAIINLDTDDRAFSVFEGLYDESIQSEKKIMYAYLLATISDEYIGNLIQLVLNYSGSNTHALLSSVRFFYKPGKNPMLREHLYSCAAEIYVKYGAESSQFKTALRNLGEFLTDRNTMVIYDIRFDQLLFDFIGYDKAKGSFDDGRCTVRNANMILRILNNVMDTTNYQGRYMKFMEVLFERFKTKKPEIAERIDTIARMLSPDGIPNYLKGEENG